MTDAASAVLKDLVDRATLAKALGRSEKTLDRWMRHDGLPVAGRRGNLILFDAAQVRRWLLRQPEPGRRRRKPGP